MIGYLVQLTDMTSARILTLFLFQGQHFLDTPMENRFCHYIQTFSRLFFQLPGLTLHLTQDVVTFPSPNIVCIKRGASFGTLLSNEDPDAHTKTPMLRVAPVVTHK